MSPRLGPLSAWAARAPRRRRRRGLTSAGMWEAGRHARTQERTHTHPNSQFTNAPPNTHDTHVHAHAHAHAHNKHTNTHSRSPSGTCRATSRLRVPVPRSQAWAPQAAQPARPTLARAAVAPQLVAAAIVVSVAVSVSVVAALALAESAAAPAKDGCGRRWCPHSATLASSGRARRRTWTGSSRAWCGVVVVVVAAAVVVVVVRVLMSLAAFHSRTLVHRSQQRRYIHFLRMLGMALQTAFSQAIDEALAGLLVDGKVRRSGCDGAGAGAGAGADAVRWLAGAVQRWWCFT